MGLIQDTRNKKVAEQEELLREQALRQQQFEMDQLNRMRYLDARPQVQEGYRQDQLYAPGLAGQQISNGVR